MRPTNFLTRSLDGSRLYLEKVSPYLFGRFGLNNRFFLPDRKNLPITGMDLRARVFDYGFNPGQNSLPAYGTIAINYTFTRNFLCWGVTSASNAVNAVKLIPSHLFQITHTHEGTQVTWFNKAISSDEGSGSSKGPTLLKQPQIVLSGDSIQIEVQNLGNYVLQTQVVLWGGEFD